MVDTERHFGQNRRLALDLLRRRVEQEDREADRAVATARWRIHDGLVRGDPIRVERPDAEDVVRRVRPRNGGSERA